MALFGMLWIVVSSWWVRAEDAQPCPKVSWGSEAESLESTDRFFA